MQLQKQTDRCFICEEWSCRNRICDVINSFGFIFIRYTWQGRPHFSPSSQIMNEQAGFCESHHKSDGVLFFQQQHDSFIDLARIWKWRNNESGRWITSGEFKSKHRQEVDNQPDFGNCLPSFANICSTLHDADTLDSANYLLANRLIQFFLIHQQEVLTLTLLRMRNHFHNWMAKNERMAHGISHWYICHW